MEFKAVDQAQIHWARIEEMLRAKDIKFVLYPPDIKKYPNSSGMGLLGNLTFNFMLGFDGSALLTMVMPETEVQQSMVDDFVRIISEVEEKDISRYPIFHEVIPGLNLATRVSSETRMQLPKPKPNLMVKIPALKSLFIEWGCQDPTSKIGWIQKYYDCEEIAT